MLRRRNSWSFPLAFTILSCAQAWCQTPGSIKHHAILILVVDQPGRPFAHDMLEGIEESTRDAIGVTVFVEFNGATALETPEVAEQRLQLRATRYAGQPIEIIVAIGDRVLPDAEKLRDALFPSAKLIFAVASPRLIPPGIRQGTGFDVDVSPFPALRLALSLLPQTSKIVAVGGISKTDEFLRKAFADAAGKLSATREITFLAGLSLPEVREQAAHFPSNSIIVLTTSMVDRSGRATSVVDQARELSQTAKIPLVEGTDLALGSGALGGDLVSMRLTGVEMGKRILHILNTGEAPTGVVVEPAPRRKAVDWRELKRFGIPESLVPRGFEILYRTPTVWEEHHGAILAVLGGLILQALMISFLLTERRRRSATQARMRLQLGLETMVAKASADLSAATYEELPAQLSNISAGLPSDLAIERVSVWIYETEEHGYVPIHWWPTSTGPESSGTFHQRFPHLYGELLAGKTVDGVDLEKLLPGFAPDIAELRNDGIQSFLAIPLRSREDPIGAFVLGTCNHRANWDAEVIATLQVLAEILAQGISRWTAEERARRIEEQSRAMLASLPGFVLMIDGAGQILRQNNRLELHERDLPASLARARAGENLLELWRADGEAGNHLTQAIEKVIAGHESSLVLEYRYEATLGTRWMEVRAERLCEDKPGGVQPGAVVSLTDTTARKKTEGENAENRQTAWHLNRVAALGELTASLAHEINQPLAAILNSAEAAATLLGRVSPDITEAMEAIQDIIHDDKRAGDVIGKIRSMLKRGQDGVQAVDLNATIRETLRLVASEARLRHVALRHVEKSGLPAVVADPTQLQQVILNLITNAIEAVEVMPGDRHVEIRTLCTGGNEMEVLEVQDSGQGIAPHLESTIFEPFYTTKPQGLGFGLSICRSIVDSFGGRIAVECPPSGGAVFRVFLRTFAIASEPPARAVRVGGGVAKF
jgi:signal transduction histidine kinase